MRRLAAASAILLALAGPAGAEYPGGYSAPPIQFITCAANQFITSLQATGNTCSAVGAGSLPLTALANINNNTILGNQSGGAGPVLALTVPQLSAMLTKPTVQIFSSGTDATYTTPANATWLEIEFQGGGGGGAGSGTTPGAAGAGGNTCWKASGTACTTPLYQATGGGAGLTNGAQSTGGGVAGSAACNDSMTGGLGGAATGALPTVGGGGGVSRYGAPGVISGVSAVGTAAGPNSGSGGGGAGSSATANSGGGGAAGGWCLVILPNPAASYTYTVGVAGTAGTAGGGGVAGGAGGSGKIRVIEHYN